MLVIKNFDTTDGNIKTVLEAYIATLEEGGSILSFSSISDSFNGRIKVIASIES